MDNENVKISASRRMRRSVINFGKRYAEYDNPDSTFCAHLRILPA